jgi:hypothetical protein
MGVPGKLHLVATGQRAMNGAGKLVFCNAAGECPACAGATCAPEGIARSGPIPDGGNWDVTAYQGPGVATPDETHVAYWRIIVVESDPSGEEGKWRAGAGDVSEEGELVGLVNSYSNWYGHAGYHPDVIFELQVGCYRDGEIHWPGTIDPVTPWP